MKFKTILLSDCYYIHNTMMVWLQYLTVLRSLNIFDDVLYFLRWEKRKSRVHTWIQRNTNAKICTHTQTPPRYCHDVRGNERHFHLSRDMLCVSHLHLFIFLGTDSCFLLILFIFCALGQWKWFCLWRGRKWDGSLSCEHLENVQFLCIAKQFTWTWTNGLWMGI